MKLFPIFADLKDRRVVVVGGGAVAERKTLALLEASADVVVGAPELTPALAALAAEGRIRHLAGRFDPAWLDDAWLTVAATDDREANAAVSQAAGERRLFCNVVDDPELSSFQVPSIVDRSPLIVAISSSGVAPVLARRLRERIESLFDHTLGQLAALAARYRKPIRASHPDLGARRRFYDWLLDGPVAGLLRPDELGDIVKLEVPEGEETDTIGGLIAEMLDRMPEVGDQVQLECTDREHKDEDDLPIPARLSLKVAKMDQYRVERVVVVRLAQEPEDDDDPDEEPVRYETVEEDGMAENQDAGLDTALKDGGER